MQHSLELPTARSRCRALGKCRQEGISSHLVAACWVSLRALPFLDARGWLSAIPG
jgi:hypothetical protein